MSVLLGRLHPIRTYAQPERDTPFDSRHAHRPVRVAIDREFVRDRPAVDLLVELSSQGYVELWSTRDEGHAWIRIGDVAGPDDSVSVDTTWPDGRQSRSGIWPASQWDAAVAEQSERRGLDPAQVRSRLMLAAACMERVDALVVDDFDFVPSERLAARSNPMSAESTCALVGLVLRLRGDYGPVPVGAASFYSLVARALLPAGWRWFSACVASSSETGDDYLVNVGQSAIERLSRAVVSRDRCIGHAQDPRASASAEEAAYYFDVELLMLSSAMDSIAHVANASHGVLDRTDLVGWRRKDWRKALSKHAPPLWEATEEGKRDRDAIEIVALLRNTIHGEGMRDVAVGTASSLENRLGISPKIAEQLAPLVERNGGAEPWGLSIGPAIPTLSPGPFCQRLLPVVAESMDRLMTLTAVEQLPGVEPGELMTTAPLDNIFEPRITERLLLLAGLH